MACVCTIRDLFEAANQKGHYGGVGGLTHFQKFTIAVRSAYSSVTLHQSYVTGYDMDIFKELLNQYLDVCALLVKKNSITAADLNFLLMIKKFSYYKKDSFSHLSVKVYTVTERAEFLLITYDKSQPGFRIKVVV